MRLASVLIADNRLEQAGALLDAAQHTLSDRPALAEIAARRAQVAFLTDDFDRAREQAELALSIADPRDLGAVVAEAAMTKAIALNYDDRLYEGTALMELSLQVALDGDVTEQALRAYYNLSDQRLLRGAPEESGGLLARGLALARERGDRGWERDIQSQMTQGQIFRGNGTRRRRCLSRCEPASTMRPRESRPRRCP